MSSFHIVVDRDLCLGAQNCKHIAPGVFDIDDDGLSYVVSADAATLELVLAAARGCPSGAIAVRAPTAGATLRPEAIAWIESLAGGGEARVMPFGHSRPLWSVDVVRGDTTVELFVRGSRDAGSVLAPVYNLEREASVIRALTQLGVPTPAVVGFHPGHEVLVLERIPGRGDFHMITDTSRRERIADRFIEVVADLHAHQPSDFGLDTVMRIPTTPSEHALAELEIAEPLFDAAGLSPEPVIAYGRRWLREHVPPTVEHTAFVQGDTGPGNFVFRDDDADIQLVDFEISHFGDPMEDLAAICVRDMVTPFVDLRSLFVRYDALTAWPLDLDRVRYHRVSKCVRSLIAIVSLAELGQRDTEHETWCAYRALYARSACQALWEASDSTCDDLDALRDLTTRADRQCELMRPAMGAMADGHFSPIE